MAQSQTARIVCIQCNAWYNSERGLRDHMQAAHRQLGSEQSLPPSPLQTDGTKQGRTSAGQQEEYTEPGEEKEGGGKPN